MDEVQAWVKTLGHGECRLEPASADASFRRYFRLHCPQHSLIVMDASLERGALAPFCDVTERLRRVGVHAPQIHHADLDRGYLLIEDLGAVHYLQRLSGENFRTLYTEAIDGIAAMQQAPVDGLPLYDRDFLLFEMNLMPEWFLRTRLHTAPDDAEMAMISRTFDAICDVVLSQPQGCFVHRDYHSRNLMITQDGSLGVIDYQDAMSGALTYDLVSLLKDCYVRFDPEVIHDLALTFRDKIGSDVDDATFLKWFDFMGMQRHIKVLGVFSRLFHRDGKPGYLNDLPLTLRYTLEAAERYGETRDLGRWLQSKTEKVLQ